ncbi:glycosyltransferase, partial [Campylobacter jejuni]
KKTSNLQQIRSRSILFKCRELFLDTKSKNLLRDFCNIPMELSKKQEIYKKIQRIQIAYQGNRDSVQKILQYFCGVFSDIHICFIFDNIQLQGLINGIFSILKNSSELDRFHFYILHNGSFQSEFSILKLRRIKDFELSIIDICKINNENISQYKTLYFKFLFALTQLKIEKCLLISSRFVVMDSLNFFWNADFEKKIIVATSSCNLEKMELFRDEFLIQENFESNVIMINLEYLLKNNFLKEILFYDKTFYFHNEILSKEEIIMNLIFKNNWKKISLRYNVQSNLKFLDNLHPILFSYQKLKDVRNKIYIDYIKENHYMRIEDFFEDNLINDLNYLSAVDIIKNSLSYKIGMRIIQSKTLSKILILPFALCNIIHQDYIEKKIRKNLEYVNPIFSTPNIEECYDYLEGEKMKKHLAYQLGECFLEHPFFFILYFIKIYINWKKNGKR